MQTNERTSDHIEATKDGRRQMILTSRDYYTVAQEYANKGWEVYIVTETTRWKGKNGKRTTEEIKRIHIPASA